MPHRRDSITWEHSPAPLLPSYLLPALSCKFWNTLYNIPVIEGQKVRGKSMIYFDWVKMYYQSTIPCSAVCMQISPVFAIASLRMAWCRLKYFKLVKVRTIYNLCKIFLHTSEVAEKTSKNTFHESSYTVPWIFCWGIEQSEWSRVIPVCL